MAEYCGKSGVYAERKISVYAGEKCRQQPEQVSWISIKPQRRDFADASFSHELSDKFGCKDFYVFMCKAIDAYS